MGEMRIYVPDELHADILELCKRNDRRLPEEVVALLMDAVAIAKCRRLPQATVNDKGDGRYYPNGEARL